MLVVPTSRIILLKNPIEMDYNHELTFTSKQAQYNYFYNLPKIECEKATYQRKDNVIRFPTDPNMQDITYDDLIQYNYCMYQNDKWSNKWFYAFIKNVTFDNPGMSYIEIETDVWQSWMFDITFKNSFIEREHVNDDTVGLHTIDEGLEIGEHVIKGCSRVTNKLGAAAYIMAVNKFISGMGVMPNRTIYGNLFSGFTYLFFNNDGELRKLIQCYDGYAQSNAIINIFTIPANLIPNITPTNHVIPTYGSGDVEVDFAIVPDSIRPYSVETDIQFLLNTDLDGYIPKNNKMLCYPFNYLVINNNAGNEVIYKYEEALNNTPTFNIEGVICPGCSIKLYPTNYKRYNAIVDNTDHHLYPKEYNYGLTLGKMPNCSWLNDAYTNWLTQNAVNEKYEDIDFGLQSFSNLPTESSANFQSGGEIAQNFISMQLNRMQRRTQAKFIPNQTKGNANAGDVVYSANILTFYSYIMTIKSEYAKICDDFMSMYGYKVNSVKLPNITGRTNWNYVKTIGCNIIGDIPQGDLMKIKSMFNNGVTLWHNPSTFLDYSQSNTIVS